MTSLGERDDDASVVDLVGLVGLVGLDDLDDLVDLVGLALGEGGHLLLVRGLARAPVIAVRGRDRALAIDVPAWCRVRGHAIRDARDDDGFAATIMASRRDNRHPFTRENAARAIAKIRERR